jgi:cytochrome c
MNPCLITKILGAVVVSVGVAGAAYSFGSLAVKPQPLTVNSFVVEMPTPAPAATVAAAAAVAAPVAASASPDAAAGQKVAKICSTCHSFNKDEAAKMGPNLYGIVGAKHAHMAGFSYSDAMNALADKAWTAEELNIFLTDPRAHIPGTKMTFAGIKNDSDRANVIAWLMTLTDKPEPALAK